MTWRIVTFSVKPKRTEEQRLISWFKQRSVNPGPDFSTLCLEALRHYRETVLKPQIAAESADGKK